MFKTHFCKTKTGTCAVLFQKTKKKEENAKKKFYKQLFFVYTLGSTFSGGFPKKKIQSMDERFPIYLQIFSGATHYAESASMAALKVFN